MTFWGLALCQSSKLLKLFMEIITLLYSPTNAAAQFLKRLTPLLPIEVCKGLLFKAVLLLNFPS